MAAFDAAQAILDWRAGRNAGSALSERTIPMKLLYLDFGAYDEDLRGIVVPLPSGLTLGTTVHSPGLRRRSHGSSR